MEHNDDEEVLLESSGWTCILIGKNKKGQDYKKIFNSLSEMREYYIGLITHETLDVYDTKMHYVYEKN